MQVWNVLHTACWKYRMQKSPSGHIAQLCRAISSQLRHVSTIGNWLTFLVVNSLLGSSSQCHTGLIQSRHCLMLIRHWLSINLWLQAHNDKWSAAIFCELLFMIQFQHWWDIVGQVGNASNCSAKWRRFKSWLGTNIKWWTVNNHWTTRLMALYPGRPGSAGSRQNIHLLTPCLCGYHTTSLINFLHFLWSVQICKD